jgi:hypothetical protein
MTARRTERRRTPGAVAALTVSAAAALAPALARADSDPGYVAVQEAVSHDSNIYRAPDGDGPVPSDWISTTSLIGSLDEPLGRGRLKLDGQLDANRFKTNTSLNANSHRLAGELDWATLDHLQGEMGYSNSEQLYRYALDSGQIATGLNTETLDQGFFRAHLGEVTRWTLDAGAQFYDRRFSALEYEENDLHRWDVSLGTTFRDTPDLAFSLSARRTRGRYENLDDDYLRDDFIGGVTWSPTGASTLVARAGVSRESHTLASQRDTHQWNASLRWQWQPTGRTTVNVSFVRDSDTGTSDFEFLNTAIVNTDARIRSAINTALAYELSAKVRATATVGWTHRQLDGAYVQPDGAILQQGTDDLWLGVLGLDWQPTRALELACNVSRERRGVAGDTQGLTYAYSATVLVCSGQFAFN